MAKRKRKDVPRKADEADEEDELCEYEQQRLAHIQRNVEYMRLMGLLDAKEAFSQGLQAQEAKNALSRPRSNKVPVPPEQLRRSDRLMGKPPPDYIGPGIEELEKQLERKAKKTKLLSAEDKERERSDMIEACRKWLEESRHSLAVLGKGGKQPETAEDWHAEAVRRWGSGVDSCGTENWEEYVLSRLSKPPAPSPLDLLQEYYAHDTWQLLVACALMSRVSSWTVKHSCISAFFEQFPTPSDLIAADSATLQRVIYPLGLFDTRLKTLLELSQKFLTKPAFSLDLGKSKIWGCGEFTVDSYNIFCQNEGLNANPSDPTLQRFVSWLKRDAALFRSDDFQTEVDK